MKRKIQDWIEQYRYMDWAVLYMRLFIGGIMLFHNIGKMQNYNEIINSYPSLLYINNTATFVIITGVEVLLSVFIMMGLWVRFSASVMALGMLFLLISTFGAGELQFIFLGIYAFLILSGGGLYAFDSATTRLESKN